MGKQQQDILQIKKYLNGELDARAMHELERRAQDDQLLMDALEGYEIAGTNQQNNLKDLSSRLQQRVEKKESNVIFLKWIPVAAAVLIILAVSVFFILNRQTVKSPRIIAMSLPAPAANKAADTLTIISEKKPASPLSTAPDKNKRQVMRSYEPPQISTNPNADVQIDEAVAKANVKAEQQAPVVLKEVSIPNQDAVVQGYTTAKRKDSVKVKSYAGAAMDKPLIGKVEGVSVTPSKTLMGTVTGLDNGQPIIGAVVRVIGAKFGAVTDVQGRFSLPDVPENASLTVGYIGYNSKRVSINKKDSLRISLSPLNSSLAEVVVTKNATQYADENGGKTTGPHPKNGWPAFKKYLDENAVSPDGKTGRVKLSFMVDVQGKVNGIKILKGLSKAADQKALEMIINNGAGWAAAEDQKAQEVKLTIKFH